MVSWGLDLSPQYGGAQITLVSPFDLSVLPDFSFVISDRPCHTAYDKNPIILSYAVLAQPDLHSVFFPVCLLFAYQYIYSLSIYILLVTSGYRPYHYCGGLVVLCELASAWCVDSIYGLVNRVFSPFRCSGVQLIDGLVYRASYLFPFAQTSFRPHLRFYSLLSLL